MELLLLKWLSHRIVDKQYTVRCEKRDATAVVHSKTTVVRHEAASYFNVITAIRGLACTHTQHAILKRAAYLGPQPGSNISIHLSIIFIQI